MLVLIGGPSGVGKSTLIHSIADKRKYFYYKRLNAFYECADNKRVDRQEAFSSVSSEEADTLFLAKCAGFPVSLSDVHYALQLKRDWKCGTQLFHSASEEPYVDVFQPHFFRIAHECNLKLLIIFVGADTREIIRRAEERFRKTGRLNRCLASDDVKEQALAEFHAWERIPINRMVTKRYIDSTSVDIEEMTGMVLNLVDGMNTAA